MAEIQQQLPHLNLHMNTGNVIQIEVPDFDPDIDEALPISTDQSINNQGTQGSVTSTQKSAEKMTECRTPAPSHQDIDAQEVDWPDAIPVEIPPQPDQHIEQSIHRGQAHREELHGHRPFGARTRSLQSHIQWKMKKTQQMRQRYANAQ